MLTIAGIAGVAALVGDPARTAMLLALMDGRALTAGELARSAGIAAPTASTHLARLTEAGLLAMERQGRHRYHRLASRDVATMLEAIMAVAGDPSHRAGVTLKTGPRDAALRRARTCYDHLAGRLAVAIADDLTARGLLELSADGGALTEEGASYLGSIGIDLAAANARVTRHRLFCRPCLDWSERRPHLAGALGSALLTACFAQAWMRPIAGSRVVEVTPAGRLALDRAFAIDPAVWTD